VFVALLVAPASPVAADGWTGRMSIWRNGSFATQYLDASCVGATIQMTLNLVDGTRSRSKSQQLKYLAYAAAQSKYPVEDDGADPEGWAAALNHFSGTDGWGWVNEPSMQSALQVAATQMRETNKPIGMLVHYGRHAWLMTGFEATADPATTTDFTVTSAEVVGPLWPNGTLNGEHFDPGPGTWMDTTELARKFNEYVEPDQPAWYGKFVIVVPRAGEVNQTGSSGQDAPDLSTVTGFITVYNRLALGVPVRDFLWLP
jgi:hypothetical protein